MNWSPAWASRLALLLALCAAPAFGATFTVTNSNDSGAGSLRQAIVDANAAAGLDTIAFAIPAAGVQTIAPTSFLPAITSPVLIDGFTQPLSVTNTNAMNAGINAVPLIELNGAASGGFNFVAGSAGSTVRGMIINRAIDNISISVDNVTVVGNFLGTNAAGTAGLPNATGGFGVRVGASAASSTIGGPNPADRNLISGNSQGSVILPFPSTAGHLIQGNYIGTDVTGTAALNTFSSSTTGLTNIGNANVQGNLISGSLGGGVLLFGNNVFQGNLVGTQRDGTTALPNGNFGGVIINGSGSTIGGSGAGQANVVAFNVNTGIDFQIGSQNNRLTQNSIHSNTALGISLVHSGTPFANDVGDPDVVPGNHGQNYPVLTSAPIAAGTATISGTINSNPSTALHLEFFSNVVCDASGFGEGQTFIGAIDVVTDASGNASFGPQGFAVPAGQSIITATATSVAGDTSEFSQCLGAGPGPGASSTVLVSSLNPSLVGQSVTFTATVIGAGPTGTIQFKDGAGNLGGPVAMAGAVATLTTSALAQGVHPISAVYSGDANNLTSTSPSVQQVVNAAGPPPPPPAPGQAIPTLSELALLLLGMLVATIGIARVNHLRR